MKVLSSCDESVGNALGVRDGYSLREAFASGLTAAATAGIGSLLNAPGISPKF